MREQIEYIKKWALQDNECLSKDQILKSIAQMCDDALQEPSDGEPDGDICPYCGDKIRTVSLKKYDVVFCSRRGHL